ncbi:MAG: hypothetical protein FJ297_00305 [Planctomycetes bacterium]|nr:hypothetical protein [Planctomycetota bacterium]
MWHLDTQRGTADLELPRLQGRVHLARADARWSVARVDGVHLDARLLQLVLPDAGVPRGASADVWDGYIRFQDLFVTYPPRDASGLSVQACWRAIADECPPIAGVELLLSLQTDGAIERPAVRVVSMLAADRAHRLGDGDPSDPRSTSDRGLRGEVLETTEAPPVVWFTGRFGTYIEMARARDFDRTVVRRSGPSWESTWIVNEERLEKGVLRRAWMRAVFAPTLLTADQVASAYDSFLAQPLPLAT